jgi:hypothetical protein
MVAIWLKELGYTGYRSPGPCIGPRSMSLLNQEFTRWRYVALRAVNPEGIPIIFFSSEDGEAVGVGELRDSIENITELVVSDPDCFDLIKQKYKL